MLTLLTALLAETKWAITREIIDVVRARSVILTRV